jgi:hypothetical protein
MGKSVQNGKQDIIIEIYPIPSHILPFSDSIHPILTVIQDVFPTVRLAGLNGK